jgi:hypothetical protein
MTLGNAAAARVRLVVWCLDCRHRVEPDPGEMAERYGAETTVPDWHARLVCSECGSRRVEPNGVFNRHPPADHSGERCRVRSHWTPLRLSVQLRPQWLNLRRVQRLQPTRRRIPVCYPSDVTDQLVSDWKREHTE